MPQQSMKKKYISNIRNKLQVNNLTESAQKLISYKKISEARNAARSQNWAKAEYIYSTVLQHHPNMAAIWVQYGHALKEQGKVEQATEAYVKAATIVPTVDTFLQLGHGYRLLGLDSLAKEAFAKSENIKSGINDQKNTISDINKKIDDKIDIDFVNYFYSDNLSPKCDPEIYRKILHEEKKHINIEHYLDEKGLNGQFIKFFDFKYYAKENKIVSSDDKILKIKCLIHFMNYGVDDLLPISRILKFDPDFYKWLFSMPPMINSSLYRHWLNHGLSAGHPGDEKQWRALIRYGQYGKSEIKDLPALQLEIVSLAKLFLPRDTIFQIFTTTENVMLVRTCAELYASSNKVGQAIELIECVLLVTPADSQALKLFGEYQLAVGHYLLAAWCYDHLPENEIRDPDTVWRIIRCITAAGRYTEAYDRVVDAIQKYPAFEPLRDFRWEIIAAYWHFATNDYKNQGLINGIPDAQKVLYQYCDTVCQDFPLEPAPHKPIRTIALYVNSDLKQCFFYRVDQKMQHLKAAGYDVVIYDASHESQKFINEVDRYEAVILFRVVAFPHVIASVEAARSAGLIIIYETDDLLFMPEYYPASYESYGGRITQEEHVQLAMEPPLTSGLMKMCDYGLASTPALARAMQPFVKTGKVFVHRNAMGVDHERYLTFTPKPRKRDKDVVRIFYGSATLAHKHDFLTILEPALLNIAKKYGKKVQFVMFGWLPLSEEFQKIAGDQIVAREPVWDVHKYWKVLSESDINVAVLKRSPFVDTKAEGKWLEASMFAIPSVVSRTETYEEVVDNGVTGILCDTVDEWTAALDRLVADPALRHSIGHNAQAVVREKYTINAMAKNISSIIKQISPEPVVSNKRRVLLVHVFYAPQIIGGATRVVHDNIMYIKKHYGEQVEIEVFAVIDGAKEDYHCRTYMWEGIKVKAVTRSAAGESLEPFCDDRMGDFFEEKLIEFRPQLVHFHCIQRLTVEVVNRVLKARIPYFITVHDSWWISDQQFLMDESDRGALYNYRQYSDDKDEKNLSNSPRIRALRPALFGARAVLAVSRPFADLYTSCGIPQVLNVENGLSHFPDTKEKTASDRVRLAHIGGMETHKGFDLIRTVLNNQHFDHLHFTAIDLSKDHGYIREEVWGNTPVTIIGKMPSSEISKLYSKIDVLLAPSRWFESYGLVTREALAHNCWVIASDRGAIGYDVVESKNGHIIDVTTDENLSEILAQVDENPELYRKPPQYVTKIRRASEQSEEIYDLYKKVLSI